MKLLSRILTVVILTSLATFYVSCDGGGGDNKSQEEVQLDKLKTTWSLVSANDGTDRTSSFTNLVLTISGTFAQGGTYNYSFTGTRPNPSPWPREGTWKFGTDVSSDIIRDPGTTSEIPMNYTVTETGLIITFDVEAGSTGWPGGSRVGSVSGGWTFEFQKQ